MDSDAAREGVLVDHINSLALFLWNCNKKIRTNFNYIYKQL